MLPDSALVELFHRSLVSEQAESRLRRFHLPAPVDDVCCVIEISGMSCLARIISNSISFTC